MVEGDIYKVYEQEREAHNRAIAAELAYGEFMSLEEFIQAAGFIGEVDE